MLRLATLKLIRAKFNSRKHAGSRQNSGWFWQVWEQ